MADGTATRPDFLLVLGAEVEGARQAMVDAAVRGSRTGTDLVSGAAWEVVPGSLQTDPGESVPEDAHVELVSLAAEAPQEAGSHSRDARDTCWAYANTAVVLLGDDHGIALSGTCGPCRPARTS